MGLCCSRRKDSQTSAVVKTSSLAGTAGDLVINGSLPRPDYIQLLIKVGSLAPYVGLEQVYTTRQVPRDGESFIRSTIFTILALSPVVIT